MFHNQPTKQKSSPADHLSLRNPTWQLLSSNAAATNFIGDRFKVCHLGCGYSFHQNCTECKHQSTSTICRLYANYVTVVPVSEWPLPSKCFLSHSSSPLELLLQLVRSWLHSLELDSCRKKSRSQENMCNTHLSICPQENQEAACHTARKIRLHNTRSEISVLEQQAATAVISFVP